MSLYCNLYKALDRNNYEEFETLIKNNLINDRQHQQDIIKKIFDIAAPNNIPKVIEIALNCGINTSTMSVRSLVKWYSSLFGCITEDQGCEYEVGYTLTLSLVRIMLQDPNFLEELASGKSSTRNNLLHSIMDAIYINLNSANGDFRWEDAERQRKSSKKHFSLLFTLIILIHPQSLEQKNHSNFANKATDSHESTPMEVLAGYNLHYERDHPDIQELYDNFQKIIELTQNGDNPLSQKIKELISYINLTKLDADELEKIVSKIKQETRLQRDTPAEKCISDVGNLIIENLPSILLDKKPEKLIESFSIPHRDSLKRRILIRSYDLNIGNINKIFNVYNIDVFEQVLNEFDSEKLDRLMEAVFGNAFEKLNRAILNFALSDIRCTVDYLNSHTKYTFSIIKKLENLALDFLSLKYFLENNPVPHKTKYKEKPELKETSTLKSSNEIVSDPFSSLGCSTQVNEEHASDSPNLRNPPTQNLDSSLNAIVRGMIAGITLAIVVTLIVQIGRRILRNTYWEYGSLQ